MAGKREIRVGQLRLVNGARQESPANLSIEERRSLLPAVGRGKGRLFVLLELSGGVFGRRELSQDLIAVVVEEYLHSPGTVTYGLRQAVLLANTVLLRANAQVSSEHRVGGIACVVLRDGEAFVAQAGWPMVYLMHRESVQAFPDTTLVEEDSSMLGQRQIAEVRLFRASVYTGDTILMTDGPMARQLGITRIGQIVSGGVEHAMSNLETLAPPEDCTAMVIQIGEPATQASTRAEQWAFMPVETPPIPDAEPLADDTPATPVWMHEPDVSPEPYEEPFEAHESPQVERPRRQSPVPARIRGTLKAFGKGMRTFGERMLPDQSPARSSSQSRRQGARTRRGRDKAASHPHWGIAAAIAVPILALIFVGGYTMYRNWSLQNQFQALLDQATLKRDIALGSVESPTVARDYWLEVISLADQAGAMQPEHADVELLRSQAQAEIDRIDGVTRLGQAHKLYEYSAMGSVPSRVIVAGLDVYVLDRGAGRVYHHALNEPRNALRDPDADQVLAQEGQPIDGQNIGSLVAIAWMKEGGERQAGELLILDRDGLLIGFDPSWEQLSIQSVGGQEEWRSPLALNTYDSNLYLLDAAANQIFKYPDQRFGDAPQQWIQQDDVDLSAAIDIGIDGNIYVLYNDGKLSRYYAGKNAPFEVGPMPQPMTRADALYLDMEEVTQYIYIADGSGMRITQLDREGKFIRQLRSSLDQEGAFQGLRGLYVDETGDKLYYITANALYVAAVPPVQH